MKKAEEQKTCSSAKLLLTAISLWRTLRQNRKGLCKTYLAGAEGLEAEWGFNQMLYNHL